MQIGRIDERCAKAGAVPPTLTPEQAAGHTWKPDTATWEAILRHSVKKAATVTITGYSDEGMTQELSRGQVMIQTSKDPAGAPIFFRDVPLISVPTGEKGMTMSIPTEAVPFIELDPGDGKARYHLAYALDKQGQLQEAIQQYRKSVELDGSNASAFASLSIALARTGNEARRKTLPRSKVELRFLSHAQDRATRGTL